MFDELVRPADQDTLNNQTFVINRASRTLSQLWLPNLLAISSTRRLLM
jgi:hypothetical protein